MANVQLVSMRQTKRSVMELSEQLERRKNEVKDRTWRKMKAVMAQWKGHQRA